MCRAAVGATARARFSNGLLEYRVQTTRLVEGDRRE